MISRDEALKALDDIFNYCEEIDYSLPENERSGYKMLPDIQKIRKYIIDNTRPRGTWTEEFDESANPFFQRRWRCSACKDYNYYGRPDFCPCCGADMRKKEGDPDDRRRY